MDYAFRYKDLIVTPAGEEDIEASAALYAKVCRYLQTHINYPDWEEDVYPSIENSRKTTPARLLYALGIPGIGTANARVLARHFKGDLDKIREASAEELSGIDGIGEIMAGAIVRYFGSDSSRQVLEQLLPELELDQEVPETQTLQIFEGKTFVVTGSVEQFANRNALKAYIEERGGKVTGSVTSKTDYLINNDLNSNSSKNRKARELGIPVISENTILNWQEE